MAMGWQHHTAIFVVTKAFPPKTHLTSDCNLFLVFIANRARCAVRVVEDDRHRRLGDSCLSLLVYQFLKIAGSDLLQVRDAEDEADRVQDVRFARPI